MPMLPPLKVDVPVKELLSEEIATEEAEVEPIVRMLATAPVPILMVLTLVAPVAMFTVWPPVPEAIDKVRAEVDLPMSRVKAWVVEAMVIVPDWSAWPKVVADEEALFKVRAPSEDKEVVSRVRVA